VRNRGEGVGVSQMSPTIPVSRHRVTRFVLLILLAISFPAQQSLLAQTKPEESSELHGGVVTPGDTPLAGAQVTLTAPDGLTIKESFTGTDGSFTLHNIPPGTYTLAVSLQGFAPASTSVTLNSGQSATLTPIALKMTPLTTSVNVVATQQDIADAQLHFEEQQRLIGIFPNFFVTYDPNAAPLTAKQKFSLALRSAADPGNLMLVGTVAGVQQAANSFRGYGQGAAGYGRRYGADLGNLVSGTFVSQAILPSLFHQDPRYFYKGTGSTSSRVRYALLSVFICRGDNGHSQPAFSTILGDMSAGAISNLYYAPSDRKGAALTLTNGLLGIAGDAMNNVFQEFFLKKLTRHAKPQP
jgi:hypothetical protein